MASPQYRPVWDIVSRERRHLAGTGAGWKPALPGAHAATYAYLNGIGHRPYGSSSGPQHSVCGGVIGGQCVSSAMILTVERARRREEQVGRGGGVLSVMYRKASAYRNRAALCWFQNGRWHDVTFRDIQRQAKQLSGYLIESGVEPGDRVAILAESRPEWGIVLFATVRAGAIAVPLDSKLTPLELTAILKDCSPRILFASQQFAQTARLLKAANPELSVALIDYNSNAPDLPAIKDLKPSQEEMSGRDRTPGETALIVYTSGTTGKPKGVMVSFQTLIFQIERLEEVLGAGCRDVFLSILPMNHLLELTFGFLGVLHAGGQVCYSPSLYPQDILSAMQQKRVTHVIAVPMFLKLLKSAIDREIGKAKPEEQRLFRSLLQIARWIPSKRLRRKLFPVIHSRMGGRLRAFVSGGAPLDLEVATFFDRLGIGIYQGYGLTETGPIVSANTPAHCKLGSVGRPLRGVEVKLLSANGDEDGEIATRGPHVMQGYYNSDGLTASVIDADGWLHTGDLGRFDQAGFLYITGRLKNLIVLAAGKKVHPEEVEEALSKASTVKEVCIIGTIAGDGLRSGCEEVCAVVVPSEELLSAADTSKERIESAIHEEFAELLQELAPFKRPSRLLIRDEPLPKTPTCKIQRQLVGSWVKEQGVVRS